MKKRHLLLPVLAGILLLTGCHASTRQSVPELVQSQPDTLSVFRMKAFQKYLDSTDIRPVGQADSLFGVLHTLRYGKKPRHLSHLALTARPDSALLARAIENFLNPETDDFLAGIRALEPRAPQYVSLKEHYRRLLRENKTDSLALVSESLNAFRWIQRFTDSNFAVVNIPSAELFVNDSLGREALRMRVIVGTRTHQTPAFGTYVSEIITYPYWNVPRSIAVNEILPKIKRNPGYLANNNMQVIGANGRVLNPSSLPWSTFTASNFPYRFRQSTGCDNALGLVKFNLENPYSIYLHDTNARSLFSRTARWLSHGCIRLQKPTELANLILNEPLFDEEYLNQCRIGATPGSIRLTKPFPVFILYLPADVDAAGTLRWNSNVYGWNL